MSSPYKTKIMRLEVDGVTVDTVELATLEVAHSGNVESKYGQDYDYQFKPRNRHAIGMKRCRFTIRKWYKADGSNTDLFYTLFDNDTVFTLKEYLTGVTGFAGLEISECEIYTYTPTTGAANDIIQEEIVGEGLYFSMMEINGGEVMNCTDVRACLEGDYSTWTVYDSFDDALIVTANQAGAYTNCLETKAILITVSTSNYLQVYDIDAKTLSSSTRIYTAPYDFANAATLSWIHKQTLLNTYIAFIDYTTDSLIIYKNGTLLQTITLTTLGLTVISSTSFSPRGKYIFITGTRVASGNKGWVVLVGS